MSWRLREYEGLPARFLSTPAKGLHKLLGGPSLISVPGPGAPLFVSTLLHGNETTGIEALQDLLCEYQGKPLPRGLLIFIGNTAAAAKGQRLLPGQPDFNRIWPDADGNPQSGMPAEAVELAGLVMQKVMARQPCAVLDLHNTSGRNPPHACINILRGDCIQLAAHFAQRVLYFTRPRGVMSMAFAPHCAAVTVESGAVNMPQHSQLTLRYLKYVLEQGAPDRAAEAERSDVALFSSVARVELVPGAAVAIEPGSADVQLLPDIDGYNWREIPSGTVIASCEEDAKQPLDAYFRVTSPEGEDITGEYLKLEERRIVTKKTLTPAMLSTNIDIIQQDCLCYFLERVC